MNRAKAAAVSVGALGLIALGGGVAQAHGDGSPGSVSSIQASGGHGGGTDGGSGGVVTCNYASGGAGGGQGAGQGGYTTKGVCLHPGTPSGSNSSHPSQPYVTPPKTSVPAGSASPTATSPSVPSNTSAPASGTPAVVPFLMGTPVLTTGGVGTATSIAVPAAELAETGPMHTGEMLTAGLGLGVIGGFCLALHNALRRNRRGQH